MREPTKVFISSPGEVGEERTILKHAIARIAREFQDVVPVESFMWEQNALVATADFQSQIDSYLQPREAYIAVFILWSRLGTPLPRSVTRDDGSRYDSGTEYEFEDAMKGFDETGTPKILVYRKTIAPVVELRDPDALEERIQQQRKLDAFFQKHFHDPDDDPMNARQHGEPGHLVIRAGTCGVRDQQPT